MNTLASLGGAFVSICHPTSLLLMATGVVVGIIFGSVPGLSAAIAVASFLPLTFGMAPSMGMNLLTVVCIGSISGGLISATLLNIPGTASSITTYSDGHPMAKNGETGRALGYGIVFSFLGPVFSFPVLTFCAPLLADITLKFTPAENFGIPFSTLTTVAALTSGSMVKGVLAGMLGLIFALAGMVPIDGTPRFTFGSSSLMAGFDALPTLIGTFTISRILITAENMGNDKVETMKMKPVKDFGFTWREFVYQVPNAIRSALIGIGIGILPGIGDSTSGVLPYVTAKNMSKHPDEFGKGCPDSVVTIETANNTTIGGATIPLPVLGIPEDGVTATMLGGFLIRGLSADPLLFIENTDVACSIFAVCILCSLFILIVEFFEIKGFVQLLKILKHILMPLILILCCVGAYATNSRIFDIQSIILFGAVDCLCHKFKLPTTPFVLYFLIGEMVEIYLRRGIMQYKSFGAFFERPIFGVFFFAAVAVVVWPIYKEWRMTRVRKMQHVLKRDK